MEGNRARQLLGVREGATDEEVLGALRDRLRTDRGRHPAVRELYVLASETLLHLGVGAPR